MTEHDPVLWGETARWCVEALRVGSALSPVGAGGPVQDGPVKPHTYTPSGPRFVSPGDRPHLVNWISRGSALLNVHMSVPVHTLADDTHTRARAARHTHSAQARAHSRSCSRRLEYRANGTRDTAHTRSIYTERRESSVIQRYLLSARRRARSRARREGCAPASLYVPAPECRRRQQPAATAPHSETLELVSQASSRPSPHARTVTWLLPHAD